ncbi:MAG: TetR/AcrR family transcriptional regulator [Methylococcales bacterium]
MDQEREESIQVRAVTKDEILLAALKLFTSKGYFKTSLIDIAELLSLQNTSLIYHHFKDKQVMAEELYVSIFDSLSISIDEIRRKNLKSSDQLRGITDLLFRLTDEAPDVIRFLFFIKLHEFLPEQKPILDTAAFVKIFKIIQSGIRNGEIRDIDPQLINAYFFGVITHTLSSILNGALGKRADAYLNQTWLVAWQTIAKK